MVQWWKRYQWLRHSSVALALILLVTVVSLSVARPVQAAEDENQAKVYATVRANPSVYVTRAQPLVYTIQVRNVGAQDARFTRVTLSYDPLQLTLAGSEFFSEKDWVSDLTSDDLFRDQVTVTFGDLNPNETRSANIIMLVNEGLGDFTVINTWAKYDWIDIKGERADRMTNAVPVVVNSFNQHSEYQWMHVEPAVVPAGVSQLFVSDRFLPREVVIFWVNAADGTPIIINTGLTQNLYTGLTQAPS